MTKLSEVKLTLGLAQHAAQNRDKWRGNVVAFCPTASCHWELESLRHQEIGADMSQLKMKAQDRDIWRTLVGGLCPRRGYRGLASK